MGVSLALNIEGMHCGGCVNRVTQALNKVSGVTVEKVEVGSAVVNYDSQATSPQAIVDAVNRIGFVAHVMS